MDKLAQCFQNLGIPMHLASNFISRLSAEAFGTLELTAV